MSRIAREYFYKNIIRTETHYDCNDNVQKVIEYHLNGRPVKISKIVGTDEWYCERFKHDGTKTSDYVKVNRRMHGLHRIYDGMGSISALRINIDGRYIGEYKSITGWRTRHYFFSDISGERTDVTADIVSMVKDKDNITMQERLFILLKYPDMVFLDDYLKK